MHSWRNWIACQPPTLKVVGAPDAEGVARAQAKARKSGNAPLREVSPPLLQLDILCARGGIGYHKGLRRLRSGFEPRRTHQKDGFIRLFLCVSAAVRSSTEGTPSGCRLTLKVAGSPDARRNTCPKIIPTMRRTRLYAEVSPPQKTKPVFVIFHFTMSEEKIVCRNCLHNL